MFAGSAGIEKNAKHFMGTFNPICHFVFEIWDATLKPLI